MYDTINRDLLGIAKAQVKKKELIPEIAGLVAIELEKTEMIYELSGFTISKRDVRFFMEGIKEHAQR